MIHLFRKWIIISLLFSWGLLTLHQHAQHDQDLHANHSVCNVCTVAQKLVQHTGISDQLQLTALDQFNFIEIRIPSFIYSVPNLFNYSPRSPPSHKFFVEAV